MARNSGNRNSNSNRRGRDSDSWYSGGVDVARERPFTTAAAAAAAVGAGVFLWSRRNQISEQISQLSDQIGEWAENMNLPEKLGMSEDDTGGLTTGESGREMPGRPGRTSRSQGSRPTMTTGMSETGAGFATNGGGSPAPNS